MPWCFILIEAVIASMLLGVTEHQTPHLSVLSPKTSLPLEEFSLFSFFPLRGGVPPLLLFPIPLPPPAIFWDPVFASFPYCLSTGDQMPRSPILKNASPIPGVSPAPALPLISRPEGLTVSKSVFMVSSPSVPFSVHPGGLLPETEDNSQPLLLGLQAAASVSVSLSEIISPLSTL